LFSVVVEVLRVVTLPPVILCTLLVELPSELYSVDVLKPVLGSNIEVFVGRGGACLIVPVTTPVDGLVVLCDVDIHFP
jgi:hypothetical protein